MEKWQTAQLSDLQFYVGAQKQTLTPAIAEGAQLSSGYVLMAPGHHSSPHLHPEFDIIVTVLEGNVLSLLGDNLEHAVPHKPGDSILIRAGVPHAGVNLSSQYRVALVECRADPMFNEDVKLLPHLDERADELAKIHQSQFVEPADHPTIIDLL